MTVLTNKLKKGTRVQLRNKWFATIADNAKGTTRMATVEGDYTETGSVYAHDIVLAHVDGYWHDVDHTPAQLKLRHTVQRMFT